MRRLTLTLGALLGAGVLSFAPTATPSASAAPSDVVAVVVDGTGYGHGRGMSQWGAYGWAVDYGATWVQILDHYYRGTVMGDIASTDRISVRLLGLDNASSVAVVGHGTDLVSWGPHKYRALRAVRNAGGTFDVYASIDFTCGAGALYLGTAASVTFTTATGEDPNSDPGSAIGLCQPSGSVVHYRGTITALDSTGTRVVNDLRVEDYLRGVVPKEVSASWGDAGGGRGFNALAAQAVAARSYALSQNRYPYARTCDSTSCQVYAGAATRPAPGGAVTRVQDTRTDAAISATAGKVRRWPSTGAVVSTEFSASNGPRTAGGAFPPIDDLGDATSKNPNHRWTRVLDADTLAAQYGLGTLISATMVEAASATNRQFDGIWFNDVVLTGTAGTKRIPAWDFRATQGLLSPGFTLRTVTRNTVGSSVALIGDSVGNSIAGPATSEYRTLTDGSFAGSIIDVVDGRCTTNPACPGASGVEVANALPFGLDLVVVELGYNDWPPSFAPTIDAMMAALQARGVRQVMWVNMADIRIGSTGESVYAQANAALSAARARWSNLTVLDWNAASSGPERPRWFSDGVHLTSTGQAEFALWLRQAVVDGAISSAGRLAPPKRIEVQVSGRTVTLPDGTTTTIPAGVTAASFNVVAVTPTAGGFITVWPCSAPRPVASSLNYARGAIDGNGVIAPVDANGKACMYSHATTDLVVDISGWFGPRDGNGSGLTAVTPSRVVDSRIGVGVPLGRVRPEAPVTVQVVGAGVQLLDGSSAVIPPDAVAAAINVTAVNPDASGYVTVWPCGVPRPLVSTLSFGAGTIRGNGSIAPLGVGGTLCVYAHAPTDVVIDVVGWFTAASTPETSAFVSAIPERWVDTREGVGAPVGRVAPSQPLRVGVAGRVMKVGGGELAIPATAKAVAVNLTVVNPATAGFATVWPCDSPRPTTASLNYPAGQITANNVTATIGPSGSICVYTHSDTHVVVDVTGWFNAGATYNAVVPDRMVDTRYGIGPAPV